MVWRRVGAVREPPRSPSADGRKTVAHGATCPGVRDREPVPVFSMGSRGKVGPSGPPERG